MEADLAARAMLGYYGGGGDDADGEDGDGAPAIRVTRRAQRQQQPPQPSSLASLVMADLKATLPQEFRRAQAVSPPVLLASWAPLGSWPTEAQADGTRVANPGTPWAAPVPGPERVVETPAGGADGAQASTEALAAELRRQRLRRPEKRAPPGPPLTAAKPPSKRTAAQKSAGNRSQQGDVAKMPIAPAQWDYSAGPQEASSGREERRKKAAAESAAGETAKEPRKDDDETPVYGPWIGKTKVSLSQQIRCKLNFKPGSAKLLVTNPLQC